MTDTLTQKPGIGWPGLSNGDTTIPRKSGVFIEFQLNREVGLSHQLNKEGAHKR